MKERGSDHLTMLEPPSVAEMAEKGLVLVRPSNQSFKPLRHLVDMLNRKTERGQSIPDDASIYTTGETVMVKGEPFRIASVDTKRLVLKVLKSEKEPRPWLDVRAFETEYETVFIGAFFRTKGVFGEETHVHDQSETDRFDLDQRLTHEGREYVVTGKALILAPVDDAGSDQK